MTIDQGSELPNRLTPERRLHDATEDLENAVDTSYGALEDCFLHKVVRLTGGEVSVSVSMDDTVAMPIHPTPEDPADIAVTIVGLSIQAFISHKSDSKPEPDQIFRPWLCGEVVGKNVTGSFWLPDVEWDFAPEPAIPDEQITMIPDRPVTPEEPSLSEDERLVDAQKTFEKAKFYSGPDVYCPPNYPAYARAEAVYKGELESILLNRQVVVKGTSLFRLPKETVPSNETIHDITQAVERLDYTSREILLQKVHIIPKPWGGKVEGTSTEHVHAFVTGMIINHHKRQSRRFSPYTVGFWLNGAELDFIT